MNVVIIGTGNRCTELYLPVTLKMPEVNLLGIYGRNREKSAKLANQYDIKSYLSLQSVFDDQSIDFLIICVSWTENANIYKKLAKTKIPALIETPLGSDFATAQEVYQLLAQRNVYSEVAEQYHLRPIEIMKRKLISKGIFGDVFYAFSDGVGHEYHGISLIRSYLGFDQKLKRLSAMQYDVPYFLHKTHSGVFFNAERIQHALLQFASGAQAAYHWSWLAYESPIRSRRIAGFYGTKGACWGEECIAFLDEKQRPYRVDFEKRSRVVKGLEITSELLAYFNDKIIAEWQNSFCDITINDEQITAAIFIKSMVDGIHGEKAPYYSIEQAFGDYQILNAMNISICTQKDWYQE